MCLCWVSTLFCMICYLFSNFRKKFTSSLRSLYKTFYLYCKCAMFLCARTPRNAMKRSIETCILLRQRKHLWIVFSFYFTDSVKTPIPLLFCTYQSLDLVEYWCRQNIQSSFILYIPIFGFGWLMIHVPLENLKFYNFMDTLLKEINNTTLMSIGKICCL